MRTSLALISCAVPLGLANHLGGNFGPALELLVKRANPHVDDLLHQAFKAANYRKNKQPPLSDPTDAIFNGIPISTTLRFTPCQNVSWGDPPFYTNTYECARCAPTSHTHEMTCCYHGVSSKRVRVPVDYSKPNGPNTFGLGVVKVPALNAFSATKGALFLNQNFAPTVALSISGLAAAFELTGDEEFDFYTWNYRGQGDSTPLIECITHPAELLAFSKTVRSNGYSFGAFNDTFPPTEANIKQNLQTVNALLSTYGPKCVQNYGDYLP